MSGIDFVSLLHTPPSLDISLAETQAQWDEVTAVLSSLEVGSRLLHLGKVLILSLSGVQT